MYLVVVESMLAQLFLIYYDGFAVAVVAAGGVVGVAVVVVVDVVVVVVAVCWTSVGLAAKFLSGICNLSTIFYFYIDLK